MSTIPRSPPTYEDLAKIDQKAEIVDGEIVLMAPTGFTPGYGGDVIFVSLFDYAQRVKRGIAIGDNKSFRVDLPKRKSFSPDAAYFIGPTTGMKFLKGAPIFAVEVRSDGDYGPKAERAIAEKRADYFAAGTLVVWDVDLLSDDVVRSYHAENPEQPACYQRGQSASAEPAVPGWSMPVDDLFYTEPM